MFRFVTRVSCEFPITFPTVNEYSPISGATTSVSQTLDHLIYSLLKRQL